MVESDPLPNTLHCTAATSCQDDFTTAINEVIDLAKRDMGPRPITFALLFLTTPHIFTPRSSLNDCLQKLVDALETDAIVGCSGAGIIGGAEEIEGKAAISLFVASVPNGSASTFHCDESERLNWEKEERIGSGLTLENCPKSPLFLLSDPFSFDIETFLEQLGKEKPKLRIVGALSNGAGAAGLDVLFHGRKLENKGCVGLQLSGDFDFNVVVSQGCKPLGPPAIITRGKNNVVKTLRGLHPREFLREVFAEASEADRKLMHNGLLLGRVVDELRDHFERGDFLVRPVLRVDETGMIVADILRTGQTVQFHARDAETAKEDLLQLVTKASEQVLDRCRGILLFSCAGRGLGLYGKAHHDTAMLRQKLGAWPVGGFFGGGEIGPVADRHFLHAFTSSIGILSERKA